MSGERPPCTHRTCSSISWEEEDEEEGEEELRPVHSGRKTEKERLYEPLPPLACRTLWCSSATRWRSHIWSDTHLQEETNPQQIRYVAADDPSDLTVEAVNLRDLSAFMVSTQKRDAVGPLGLEHQQVRERLQAVVASVHEVALQSTCQELRPQRLRSPRELTMKM